MGILQSSPIPGYLFVNPLKPIFNVYTILIDYVPDFLYKRESWEENH